MGDYEVSRLPCRATPKKRVYSSTSSSRSDPFLISFFYNYNMTFHHPVMISNAGELSLLCLWAFINTNSSQANGTPTFLEYRSTPQTWVCFRITWSTYYYYYYNTDCWILLSEVLILEIGVGQENLIFWQVPRWCRCCWYDAHLENYWHTSEILQFGSKPLQYSEYHNKVSHTNLGVSQCI